MNHLDVGYYDGLDKDVGFAVQVLNRYQTEYFARAIRLSLSLIKEGYVERYVYTTHPWLVSLYLDCPKIKLLDTPLKCPTPAEQETFKKAVKDGHIAWHAFPMNIQTDFLGANLFEYGLSLGEQLDARFGINRTHATMSQRDIPGMTKALLPLLMKHKVKAISVGVNPGTAPPAVPSPFVWKLRDSDPDGILAFWDKGGYPINPGPNPADPKGLARGKCVITSGLDEALCFAFRTDNTGPPESIQEWLGYYEILRAEFPGAELMASTFDNFVAVLEKVKSNLPVRSFEIGDTWIQGIASDPKKCAMYRAFVRAWEICSASGKCELSDSRIQAMLRFLIKLPEHTWGAHDFLDHTNWSNEDLAEARHSKEYVQAEDSWREQRQFLDFAFDALGNHPLRDAVKAEYENLQPKMPDFTGYLPASLNKEFTCPGGMIVKFGKDGSLVRLYDPLNKREWASSSSPLGKLTYDTYVEEDFIHMAKLYNYEAGVGYDKPNITLNAHPQKKRWDMVAAGLFQRDDWNSSNCDFILRVATQDNETRSKYGAPEAFYLQYTGSQAGNGLEVTVLMKNKTTTRMPESLSYGHTPLIQTSTPKTIRRNEKQRTEDFVWSISKMGQNIDPCDVVLNGSQYVHGKSMIKLSYMRKI
ncbi:coiled-coil domain-containing protein 90B, mitochondrial [Elysia marginata]|uniref:Coiled-coil domain-containing protein 90B, mitochondrial n=1 Tax=Elysia marginata TaxID=1093978 RepID=A0AAV4H2Y6_9GAST|nr:coiled-coil domain-containing protein 90B, mitochondrial [Elysia marginata]